MAPLRINRLRPTIFLRFFPTDPDPQGTLSSHTVGELEEFIYYLFSELFDILNLIQISVKIHNVHFMNFPSTLSQGVPKGQ